MSLLLFLFLTSNQYYFTLDKKAEPIYGSDGSVYLPCPGAILFDEKGEQKCSFMICYSTKYGEKTCYENSTP